jgi:hypothetical protein
VEDARYRSYQNVAAHTLLAAMGRADTVMSSVDHEVRVVHRVRRAQTQQATP